MAMDSEVIQRQHFCHQGDTICHPKSGYVATKLHGTCTCGCNNNAIFSGRAILCFLPSSSAGHINMVVLKHWRFMPKWKDGSTVEFNMFRVQDFLSA